MRLLKVSLFIAVLCMCAGGWGHAPALAQKTAQKERDRWVVYEPLRPPYSIMRIVNVMGAIQTGRAYSKKHMDITYDYRAEVNDGLAGCSDAVKDGTRAWFVTTLDDSVHEVVFERDKNGVLKSRPGAIMAGPYQLDMKWGCFRDKVFLANIRGESAVGPEACRTPIPYGYCDLNGLIFWQLADWDKDFVPAPPPEEESPAGEQPVAGQPENGAAEDAPGEEGEPAPDQDSPVQDEAAEEP